MKSLQRGVLQHSLHNADNFIKSAIAQFLNANKNAAQTLDFLIYCWWSGNEKAGPICRFSLMAEIV